MGNLQEKQSVKQPFRPSADPDSAITPGLAQLYPPPLQFRVDDRGKTEKVAEGHVLQRTISSMGMEYGKDTSLAVIVDDINGTMKLEKGEEYRELDEGEIERVKGFHEDTEEDHDIWDVIRAIRGEDFAEDDGSASEELEPILIVEGGKTFFGLVKPSDGLGSFDDDGGFIEQGGDGSWEVKRGDIQLQDGDYNYVVYVPGGTIVAVGLANQIEHAELANGREKVGFAGEVTFKDRQVVSWNNKSGHFIPVAEYSENAPFPAGKFTEYG